MPIRGNDAHRDRPPERCAKSRHRYIATCRANATGRRRLRDNSSDRDSAKALATRLCTSSIMLARFIIALPPVSYSSMIVTDCHF